MFLDQFFTAKTAKRGSQHRGAEQDDKHHRSRLGSVHHDTAQRVFELEGAPGCPADRNHQHQCRHGGERNPQRIVAVADILDIQIEKIQQDKNHDYRANCHGRRVVSLFLAFHEAVTAHHHCADSADGAGLVDRGDTQDYRAQYNENQRQRRHQCQQYPGDKLVIEISLEGHRWGLFGIDQGRYQDVEHIEPDQNHARDKGAHEHVAGACGYDVEVSRHRKFAGGFLVFGLARGRSLVRCARQLVGKDNQYDRWRNDLPEGARRADGAAGKRFRIVIAQHRW